MKTPNELMNEGWVMVSFAGECEEDEFGEPSICSICGDFYDACACPGPTQEDEFDYCEDEYGELWAKKKADSE